MNCHPKKIHLITCNFPTLTLSLYQTKYKNAMQQNIEHPENDACYEGLAVNKGIEQPDPVNPAIAERLKHLKKKTLTADEYVTGIFRGDINILSQAITLVESARIDHQAMAQEVINRCLPNTGKSVRIGITCSAPRGRCGAPAPHGSDCHNLQWWKGNNTDGCS